MGLWRNVAFLARHRAWLRAGGVPTIFSSAGVGLEWKHAVPAIKAPFAQCATRGQVGARVLAIDDAALLGTLVLLVLLGFSVTVMIDSVARIIATARSSVMERDTTKATVPAITVVVPSAGATPIA